ncbi:tetratricopeptide repeat protein [Streptomyces sp. NPDC049099]|uniref:ATP-binding protein n=1 Tax=Streptomyces sp. NPDC049099 TaxID=3155768 RepID=UPI003433A56B
MSDDVPGSRDDVHNETFGTVRTVVQAGSIFGGVHVHEGERTLPVPRQLPNDIPDFSGRADALEVLDGLRSGSMPNPATVIISAIAGTAGIGKTALAVHWAHQVKEEFPAGQLYVNLRGYDPARPPVSPGEALTEFLLALEVPVSRIPADVDAQAVLYRSLLAGRRFLVVLDNASSARQVEPLLPGTGPSIVVITSRQRLTALDGVVNLRLDVLDRVAAAQLLGALVGHERVAAEPGAAGRIVQLCGMLPLAIRIAGARIAASPHWTLSRFARRLEAKRLDELRTEDREVRGAFALTYDRLPEHLKEAFVVLGLHDTAEFPAWSLAAMLHTDVDTAEEMIDALVSAQLVDFSRTDSTGTPAFRMHDLIRDYARELLARWSRERMAETRRRLAAGSLSLTRHALSVAPGGVNFLLLGARTFAAAMPAGAELEPFAPTVEVIESDPARWFGDNTPVLTSAVRRSAEVGDQDLTAQLAFYLAWYFRVGGRLREWQESHQLALDAVTSSGHRGGEAAITRSLGNLSRDARRFTEAIDHFERASALYQEAGDELGTGQTLNHLGDVAMEMSRFDAALRYFADSLAILRRHEGAELIEAYTLNSVGCVHRDRAAFTEAAENFDQALSIFRRRGDRVGEAWCLRCRGENRLNQGLLTQARADFERAVPLFEDLGDRGGGGWNHRALAELHRWCGDHAAAAEHLTSAFELFREVGELLGEAWTALEQAELLMAIGDAAGAVRFWQRAAELFADLDIPRGEAFVQLSAGRLRSAGIQPPGTAPDDAFATARDMFRQMGDHNNEGWALLGTGTALVREGRLDEAVDTITVAAEIFSRLDARTGRGAAWLALAEVALARHDIAGCRAALANAASVLHPECVLQERLREIEGRTRV